MDNFWKLEEQNTFSTGVQSTKILYQSNLNILLIVTKNGEIVVVDVTTGAELHKSLLSDTQKEFIDGTYVKTHNKLLLTNGRALGMRSDYNGILLFDTILQPTVEKSYDIVEIELPVFEALLIHQALKQVELPAAESVVDLTSKLEIQIAENGNNDQKGTKAEKWGTIKLKSTHNSLKWVASTMTSELRRQNRYIPALSIASSINERLNCLLPSSVSNINADRALMFSEANRRETFTKWPHMDYKWALPDQMAQAGFYHQPNTIGDDRAMCFTCVVCLVCWEPTDEPWSEHERHAPTCPFVRGEYTQNVPLSVNYATAPANTLTDRVFFGTSSLTDVLPTFSKNGIVTLYNVSRFLKIITEFHVTASLTENYQPPMHHHYGVDGWEMNENKTPLDLSFPKTITEHLRPLCFFDITSCSALSLSLYHKFISELENYKEKMEQISVDDEQPASFDVKIHPCVVVGVKKAVGWNVDNVTSSVETMNNVNDVLSGCSSSAGIAPKKNRNQLLLAVYDFHYKDLDDSDSNASSDTATNERAVNSCKTASTKKSGTGTGTAISRNKDCDYYGKIYDTSTNLLDDINLMETENHSPNQTVSVNISLQSGAFMFPPLGPAQLASNNATTLSEQVESLMSSTSTGTISSSEEKIRDGKTDAEGGEDGSREGGSRSTLPKMDSMDLDKEASLVQSFCVLDQCHPNLEISNLYPVLDGQHLLVVVRNNDASSAANEAATPMADDAEEGIGGVLLLFKISFKGLVLGLEEVAVQKRVLSSLSESPREFVILPMFLKRDESYLPYGDVPMGVMLTESGELQLINLNTLKTVSRWSNESSKFVSAAYCDHIEKLCVVDESGGLHYISVIKSDCLSVEPGSLVNFKKQTSSFKMNKRLLSHLSKENYSIDLHELKSLYRLTHFENVVPCYLADVPACWNEVKQAQKQRRHPQLLQQSDGEQHTRTWKLQIGEKTWDEHVFQLMLPRSMCIGHVDVKFSLHSSCQFVPSIQVTLLRLKGSCETDSFSEKCSHQASQSTENVDLSFPSGSKDSRSVISFSNPVSSKDYHTLHNTEILCGPVNIIKYLDLSKRSGTITLTSPKLFQNCCRTLILHIKALGGFSQETSSADAKTSNDKTADSKKKNVAETLNKSSKYYSTAVMNDEQMMKKDQCVGNTNKKPMSGCDWIQELSVTIRKPKKVDVPNELSERCNMLESIDFVEGLLEAFCQNDEEEYRLIAADILNWVASVRMCRFRPIDDDICATQMNLAHAIEAKLGSIVQLGFIEGNRKLAHKITKLLIACSVGCKNAQDADMVDFDLQLLKMMVYWIPKTLQCQSAGAFRWFFQLLLYVLPHDKYSANAPQKCFSLLMQIAKELHSRQNPYHLLLRTRYGLYGNPFESELFDIEPIIPGKSSSVPVTYANLVAGPNITFTSTPGNEPIMNGFFSLLKPVNSKEPAAKTLNQKYCNAGNNNPKADLSFLNGISASHYMKGLLEVEPLHFTCHATSDGTRVERVDTDVADEEAIVNYYGPATAPGNAFQPSTAFAPYPSGLKKTEKVYIFQDIGDISQTPLESLVSDEAFQHFQMSVLPKLKHEAKTMEAGKQLIVIDGQAPGPSSYIPTPIYHDKITYAEAASEHSDNGFPWQQLLIPPPQQTIIIDRMHSGAKRFVVLDFGFPVCLTDMLIPPCPELLSLSIDIWTQSEEVDGKRLVVASDIGSKMLIMSDISPPPICRYLKITAIGRYGMSTTKCRIPIGTFYGHSYVLASDGYAEDKAYSRPNSELNIQMLCGMMEDVQCRYSLACSRLREQLTPFLMSEVSNVDHMNHYLNKGKSKTTPTEAESQKIHSLYKDCITYQHQMNLIRNVMNRLCTTNAKVELISDMNSLLAAACTDKLRNLTEALLDLLLYFVYELGSQIPSSLHEMLDKELCQNMFTWLCVGEDSRTQISTCTLLVRFYGFQPGWGEFLVNTFTQLYSSNYPAVFPQDRVFVLLSYLGRKSIMFGGNQNNVIEHILQALLVELLPLADTTMQGFVRGKLDLHLLSWLLMFFLQCVEVLPSPRSVPSEDGDSSDKDSDNIRWNFIQSEIPIHRKRMMVDKKGWSRNFRRAIQKKVLHNKHQIKDLETAKKSFQLTTQDYALLTSSQALGKLSNHALKLKQELQNVLKNIPISNVTANKGLRIKPAKGFFGNGSGSSSGNGSKSASNSDGASTSASIPPGKVGVEKSHCLPVIRALLAFMLHVDITCNVDLFLISCKVVSCLLQISNSPILLGEILTEEQLLKLLQMAVWCENGKSMCGGKWTSHAITCLLQDIIDKMPKSRVLVRARRKSSAQLEGNVSSDFADMTSMDSDSIDPFSIYVSNADNPSEIASKDLLLMCSTPKCDNSQLPSLMESDDSETEDNLEEFLMDERNSKELAIKNKNNLLPNISIALDSRLEFGVEESIEIFLRNLADKSSCNLLNSVNSMMPACNNTQNNTIPFKMDHLTFPWVNTQSASSVKTAQMFSSAFDKLFTDFNIMESNNNLEEALNLWLLLSGKNNYEQDLFCSVVPLIPISANTVVKIMTATSKRTPPSIRLWFLLFKTLTIVSNLPFEDEKLVCKNGNSIQVGKDVVGATEAIIQHEQFPRLLSEFLSSPFVDDMAGENVVQAFSSMLNRIRIRAVAVGASEGLAAVFKEHLLSVLCDLLSNFGPVANRRGPLDAQIAFLALLQDCDFMNSSISRGVEIIVKIGDILPPYVQIMNSIKCCTSSEIPANPASCFAPPALKSATTAPNVDGRRVGPFGRDHLMMQVLKFASKLLRMTSGVENESDQNQSIDTSTISVDDLSKKQSLADHIMKQDTKMYQFLSCLNSCYRSSLLEIADWQLLPAGRNLTNHSTVADGVYYLLCSIFSKASDVKQKITVIYNFISSSSSSYVMSGNASMQISDPMLSLISKVLIDEESIRHFIDLGTAQIICENLKRSFSVILNQHPSTVSSVMQYMYGPHGFNVPTTAIKGKKKHSVDRNEDGLINFAPLGTIILDNPAAQPADVLLMSATPHRRARSAAWSYHFYPEEKSVDLKILLPCAVLLKEVHLQPHHMSLATSPKAISLEISRGGGEYVPIQAPVRTSGLAFLHMTLYQPEVVTSVLIRCYKPKESSGIGLSQIRLLGYSAFGDRTWRNTYNDIPTDHQLMNTSIAWLRLFYHTLSFVKHMPDLEARILDTLASSDETISCVCGLLLLPSPLPMFFNRLIAYILLRLSLHSKTLCFNVLKTLLRNGIGESYKSGKPLSATATNAVFELVYQIGSTSDSHNADRITMLLNWLTDVAKVSLQNNNTETPIPTFVYCISCVLWPENGARRSSDQSPLISSSLFDLLLQWSSSLPVSSILKRAVDRVLCSIYVIKPENYILLLKHMSIVKDVSEDDSATKIDVKSQSQYLSILPEEEHIFELYTSTSLADMNELFLSEKMFTTLATISQSRIAVQQLIGCGFLGSLANIVSEFCLSAKLGEGEHFADVFNVGGDSTKREQKRPSAEDRLPMFHVDTISAILDFFSELCWEGPVRKWLGCGEVSVFWEHLLEYLCKTVPSSYTMRNDLPSDSLTKLEDTTIKFLSRCCWCYPKNQKTLASIVYNVIDATPRRYSKYNLGVTDFTRRVLLQLVLETEKVFVSVEGNLRDGINWQCSNGGVLFPPPPQYPPSSRQQLLYLNTSFSCVDIISKVIGSNESSETATAEVKMINPEDFIDVEDDVMDEYCDKITLAAGVTAKDKRLKDPLVGNGSRDENAKKLKKLSGKDSGTWVNSKDRNLATSKLTLWVPTEQKFIHVGQDLTISQMLQVLADRGNELDIPVIKFLIVEQNDDTITEDEQPKDLVEAFGYAELPSVLKEFVDTRGLEMVAHRLPMVFPTHYLRMVSSPYDTPTCSQIDPSWVKLDVNDDIYEEVMDEKGGTSTMNMNVHPEKRVLTANENLAMPSVIPPHSLMAFGQFLKLPNYAEWLIRDRKQAQCLLRLVLGGGDEADFNIANDPAKSLILNSLPTLPFEILRYLFKSTPISSDEGLNLRIAALKHGAVHVILACLAIFTHQPEAIHLADSGNQHVALMMALKQCCSNVSNKKSEDKSHQYWAKGTGFGTGSTTQSWNVEQALCRQRFEEEHVTVFLQILACYINPDLKLQDRPLNYICEDLCDVDQDEGFSEQPPLPSLFIDLIEHSCLLSALASYLRNDSVLDMARHIPLYRAILVLLRVMALNSQLVKFLLPTDYSNRPCSSKDVVSNANDLTISLVELLQRMKSCVDTYSSRLKKNRGNGEAGSQHDSLSFKAEDEEESGEGLTTLIPDIRATAKIVEIVTEKIISKSNLYGGKNVPELNASAASVEETYLKIMKNLQFDTFDMISEDTESLGLKFNVSYHFEPNLHSDVDKNHPSRMKRLAQEAVTLSTSLPLSYSSSVFVRCDTDRLDVMKVLITGPAETPYANGCFEFDVYFPPDYPNSPMLINLETTGRHSVRFNPNLYNDGKVCLSVLNTWHGRPEEKWNAHTSSFLQVLVSIQSLILVPEPYFNEPGYERSRGTASGNQNSREYNANIMQATVRWAMLDQIRNPSPCFKDIIQSHFWLKRNEITNQITTWINEIENEVSDSSKTNRNLSHGTMSLKCHFKMLCDEFAKLTPPPGLEELSTLPQFEYKAPSSPASLPSVVELSTTASTSAPATSSLPLATYAQMEKIITELLD